VSTALSKSTPFDNFSRSDTSSLSTMWSFGRKSQVQLLVGACGTIIGWEKVSPDEDVRDLLAFLETISNGSTKDLPSIIAYDRACKVLGVVASDPKLLHWLDDVKFIVDSFHYVGHSKKDALCRTFCDPAPMDGSAPDLVTPFVEIEVPGSRRKSKGRSKRLFRRAFNTEVRTYSGYGVIADGRHRTGRRAVQ
jgi:hypothetical protein